MSIFLETLQAGLAAPGIEIAPATIDKLARHWQLVKEYNQKFNLTAITDDEEAATKHYADCLLALPRLLEIAPARAADIGSGAGFPGLVLALACPHTEWRLLEANGKKCGFLQLCLAELGIENARALPLRAEQAGQDSGLRGHFDLVTARAVAPLSVLLEYALPLLGECGMFLAFKGPALAEEEQQAQNALAVLCAQPTGRKEYTLPGGEQRFIATYQKKAPTPAKYPRRAGMPEKRPL